MSVLESRRAELARELNAVYGLIEFARARCYPPTLTDRLQHLLRTVEVEAEVCAGGAQRISAGRISGM